MTDKLLKIIEATIVKDYKVACKFQDGKIKLYDFEPLLKFDVFKILKDNYELFKNFKLAFRTITWCDGTIDLDPEDIYEHGKDISLEFKNNS